MLHTVEFGNYKTGYFFLQILISGYAKWMLIDKGGYDATIWAARLRHPLVQVTLPGTSYTPQCPGERSYVQRGAFDRKYGQTFTGEL